MATNYIILENYEEAQNYKLNSFKDIVIFKCSELKMLYIKKYSSIALYACHLSKHNSIWEDLSILYKLGIPEIYKYPKKVSGLQLSIYNKLIKPYAEYRHYNAITNIREVKYSKCLQTNYPTDTGTISTILQPLLSNLFPNESFEGYQIYFDNIEKEINYIMHEDLLSLFPKDKLIANAHLAKEKLNNLTPLISGYSIPSIHLGIHCYKYRL